MDDIELAILDAWRRVGPRILANPKELSRRLARREGRLFSRPPRAWCLAVRASDRRVGRFLDEYPQKDLPERVRVDAVMLRELCRNVQVSRGGEVWDDVARRVGRGFRGLDAARVKGRLRARHVPLLGGRRGNPVPVLSADGELDPNWRGFEGADAAWGWTGKYLVNRIPEDFEQALMREPVWRGRGPLKGYDHEEHPEVEGARRGKPRERLPPPQRDFVWYKWSPEGKFLGEDKLNWRKSPSEDGFPVSPGWSGKKKRSRKPTPSKGGGSLEFRGWMWVCPGCGKRVRTMYLPVPRDLLVDSCELLVGTASESALATINHQPSTIACYSCHRIRGFSRIDKNGWNDLIGYLSGGMLFGREVRRPEWFGRDGVRKVSYTPRSDRPAPRRQQVLRRMLLGWTITRIAGDLKMCKQQVTDSIRAVCRQEGVGNRRELARKLGSKHPQPGRRRLEPQMNTD